MNKDAFARLAVPVHLDFDEAVTAILPTERKPDVTFEDPREKIALSYRRDDKAPILLWDGLRVVKSKFTDTEKLRRWLKTQDQSLTLYWGQDSDGGSTSGSLSFSVRNRMAKFCNRTRGEEDVQLIVLPTGLSASWSELPFGVCKADKLPFILAQNPDIAVSSNNNPISKRNNRKSNGFEVIHDNDEKSGKSELKAERVSTRSMRSSTKNEVAETETETSGIGVSANRAPITRSRRTLPRRSTESADVEDGESQSKESAASNRCKPARTNVNDIEESRQRRVLPERTVTKGRRGDFKVVARDQQTASESRVTSNSKEVVPARTLRSKRLKHDKADVQQESLLDSKRLKKSSGDRMENKNIMINTETDTAKRKTRSVAKKSDARENLVNDSKRTISGGGKDNDARVSRSKEKRTMEPKGNSRSKRKTTPSPSEAPAEDSTLHEPDQPHSFELPSKQESTGSQVKTTVSSQPRVFNEKLPPIDMNDILTATESALVRIDLSDVLSLRSFIEDMEPKDRAFLYELLPEVDRSSPEQLCKLFTSNMQFRASLSHYQRLVARGTYDPSSISKERNKRRRAEGWDPKKEAVFEEHYAFRLEPTPVDEKTLAKWADLEKGVVEAYSTTTSTAAAPQSASTT